MITSTSLVLSDSDRSDRTEFSSVPSSSSSSSSSPSSIGTLQGGWLLLWSLSFFLFLLPFLLRTSEGSLDRGRWMWWEECRWSETQINTSTSELFAHNRKHLHALWSFCTLTFNVFVMVNVVLLIRHGSSRREDLLEALDTQGFIQVPIILLFWARRPV